MYNMPESQDEDTLQERFDDKIDKLNLKTSISRFGI